MSKPNINKRESHIAPLRLGVANKLVLLTKTIMNNKTHSHTHTVCTVKVTIKVNMYLERN